MALGVQNDMGSLNWGWLGFFLREIPSHPIPRDALFPLRGLYEQAWSEVGDD